MEILNVQTRSGENGEVLTANKEDTVFDFTNGPHDAVYSVGRGLRNAHRNCVLGPAAYPTDYTAWSDLSTSILKTVQEAKEI